MVFLVGCEGGFKSAIMCYDGFRDELIDYIDSEFTSAAKSLFKPGAGVFFLSSYVDGPVFSVCLRHGMDDQESSPRYFRAEKPRNDKDFLKTKRGLAKDVALFMLHKLSLDERLFSDNEELQSWLAGLDFDESFIRNVSAYSMRELISDPTG